MKCYIHNERDSIGKCEKCGNLICQECTVKMNSNTYCKSCIESGQANTGKGTYNVNATETMNAAKDKIISSVETFKSADKSEKIVTIKMILGVIVILMMIPRLFRGVLNLPGIMQDVFYYLADFQMFTAIFELFAYVAGLSMNLGFAILGLFLIKKVINVEDKVLAIAPIVIVAIITVIMIIESNFLFGYDIEIREIVLYMMNGNIIPVGLLVAGHVLSMKNN